MLSCSIRQRRMEAAGIEPAANSPGKKGGDSQSGAESGAPGGQNADSGWATVVNTNPELARLIDAWPKLPEAIRRGILAMVETAMKMG